MYNTRITHHVAGIAATLGLALASAFASPSVSLSLKNKEFGKGKTINVNSGTFLLSPSTKYTFKFQGTCRGTGALAKLVPKGTPIVTFFSQLSPGIASSLSGTYSNPSGQLPIVVINKTVKGTKKVANVGNVTLGAKLEGGTLANGQVYFKVSNVTFTSATPVPLGTILFENSAKLIITRVPEVQFDHTVQHVSESAGSVVLTILRQGINNGAVSVNYAMTNVTATNADYTASSGVLNFADGVTTQTLTIPITPNTIKDGSRRFTVTLSSPTGSSAILGLRSAIDVVIDDDD